MASKKDSNTTESTHSLHSQDTELIEEAISSFDAFQNSSTSLCVPDSNHSSDDRNSSLYVHPGSDSQDQSLIDFSTNESTLTACSTPHASKIGSTCKRRFTSDSSGELVIKKQKLFEKGIAGLDDSALRSDKDSLNSMPLESSHEDVSSLPPRLKSVVVPKTPEIEYAEANSSTSPSERLISTSSSDTVTTMTRKARSPFHESNEKNPLRKAYSDDHNGVDDTATLKARNMVLENEISRLEALNRDLQNALIHKRQGECKGAKEHRGKHVTEKLLCSVSYTYDEVEGEVTSISIRQVSKADLFEHKQPRLSLSSGSLADSSGSELNWVQRGPSLASFCSSSSVPSSSSSGSNPYHPGRHQFNKFLVPPIPEPKKHLMLKYPKSCVCQCYCSTFVDCMIKSMTRCITPDSLSSSSGNLKSDSQDLTSLSSGHQEEIAKSTSLDIDKIDDNSVKNSDNCSEFRSRSSIYIPASKNLPVFAKWPSNAYWYPGIIENASEDTWHTNSHLEVKFCDGTLKKILCANLFPAYLLPARTDISFEKDDVCKTAKLISIQRLINNELICLGEIDEGIKEIVNIKFEKIFLTNYCYNQLKKENASSLTPKKTPKFSISTDNVTEGKRTRKVVKFESSNSKLSSSSGRKTRSSKSKRVRSATDSSGSDVIRPDRKRTRSWSQKKLEQKKTEGETSTPHVSLGEKSNVIRKLIPDTPSSCKASTQDTDTDSSSFKARDVNFMDLLYPGSAFDTELVMNISQRALKPKSLSKKNPPLGIKDDRIKGPIPHFPLFSGYNFVLTQAEPKENDCIKRKSEESYSDEGSSTDLEDYYQIPSVPFDYIRLKEQIQSGEGRVYQDILSIPKEEHTKTLVITDNIVETPNYLLAVSLGIPIYRHDLIVDCCLESKHISMMIGQGMRMPVGRSIDDGTWVLKPSSSTPLKGYTCMISLSSNESTLNFWSLIIENVGGKTIVPQDPVKIMSAYGNHLGFVLGDEGLSKEVRDIAKELNIPIVSTVWVIQTIIHGKPRIYDSHSKFIVPAITG